MAGSAGAASWRPGQHSLSYNQYSALLAGSGWAGLGWAGLGGRYQLVSARQPAQPAAILPVTAAPPSALLHNLLHPGVWLLRPRRGPSWLPAPAAEEGSYQGSLGPVLGPRLELAEEVNK